MGLSPEQTPLTFSADLDQGTDPGIIFVSFLLTLWDGTFYVFVLFFNSFVFFYFSLKKQSGVLRWMVSMKEYTLVQIQIKTLIEQNPKQVLFDIGLCLIELKGYVRPLQKACTRLSAVLGYYDNNQLQLRICNLMLISCQVFSSCVELN